METGEDPVRVGAVLERLAAQRLAARHRGVDDTEAALGVCMQALEVREAGLGESHVATRSSRRTAARVLMEQHAQRVEDTDDDVDLPLIEACALLEKNVACVAAHKGPVDAETIHARLEAATMLHRMAAVDKYKRSALHAAREAYSALLIDAERELGSSHCDTLAVKTNLALCWSELGVPKPAESLARDVLKARMKRLGGTHPLTAKAFYNVGAVLKQTGKHSNAQKMFLEAAKVYAKTTIYADDAADARDQASECATKAKQGKFSVGRFTISCISSQCVKSSSAKWQEEDVDSMEVDGESPALSSPTIAISAGWPGSPGAAYAGDTEDSPCVQSKPKSRVDVLRRDSNAFSMLMSPVVSPTANTGKTRARRPGGLRTESSTQPLGDGSRLPRSPAARSNRKRELASEFGVRWL